MYLSGTLEMSAVHPRISACMRILGCGPPSSRVCVVYLQVKCECGNETFWTRVFGRWIGSYGMLVVWYGGHESREFESKLDKT